MQFFGILKHNSVFVTDESSESLQEQGFGAKLLRPIVQRDPSCVIRRVSKKKMLEMQQQMLDDETGGLAAASLLGEEDHGEAADSSSSSSSSSAAAPAATDLDVEDEGFNSLDDVLNDCVKQVNYPHITHPNNISCQHQHTTY